ncbi:MAG: hypothetical protein HPY44_09730 [Armatimonadetes bacterium]|nr:hypothetical protein [Armatimonadota bacterium]
MAWVYRRRNLRSAVCMTVVTAMLLLVAAPAFAQGGGIVGPSAYVGPLSIADFIRGWRAALAGAPWEERHDLDGDGTPGANDARLLIESYLSSTWVPDRNDLITAVGAGGQGCAAVLSRGNGVPWSETGKLVVPPGARELVIGASPDLPNSDLQGAQIKLTSPGGARTVTLSNGAATYSGFAERSPAAPATDAALYNYFVDITRGLPPEPTDSDWEQLMNALVHGDPELPQLSDAFWASAQSAMDQLDGLSNTVLTHGGTLTPEVGLVINGPQSGEWTIEVSSGPSAGPFVATVWTVPATDSGTDNLVQVAEAMAASVGAASVQTQKSFCTGCDPGCEADFAVWRNPPEYSAQWFYLKIWGTVISIITWWLLRGSFTKVIDILLARYVWLKKVYPLIEAIIPEHEYKLGSIYLISRIYSLILKQWPKVEALILRLLYSTGFDPLLKWGTRWNQICYIGLSIPGVPIWLAGVVWDGPFVIEMGKQRLMLMIGANPLRMSILPDHWGRQERSDTVKSGNWDLWPSNLLIMDPRATSKSQCLIECPEDPIDDEGTLTLTINDQPAKAEFPVEIVEACEEPGPGFIVYTPHRTGEYAVYGAASYSELAEPSTWAEADAVAASPGLYGYVFLGKSKCSKAFPEGYFRYLIMPTGDKEVHIDALYKSSVGWYWSAYYWADEPWKLDLITHYSKFGTPGWRAVTGTRDGNACSYAPGGYLNLLGQCWCQDEDGPCECQKCGGTANLGQIWAPAVLGPNTPAWSAGQE